MINQYLMEKIQQRIANAPKGQSHIAIPIGISNRHVHLSAPDIAALFGPGYALTPFKALKQTGQFAAKESVMIVGPKGSITKVRVLGPARPQTQLEISKADCFTLGIQAPIRESGDLADSADALLIGPYGHVYLKSQVICAQRHIHMDTACALQLQVHNGQKVKISSAGKRSLIFDQVIVRVDPAFTLECHIDTDEANAAGLKNNDQVYIVA